MSNGFWEAQRAQAHANLWDAAHAAGEAWQQKHEQKKFDANQRREYAIALEAGKTSGEMPIHLQETIPVDELGKQVGIKVVALRKLAKSNPKHPLVNSADCRNMVGKVTLVQFNRADRPDVPINQFAPDDETSGRVFEAYGENWTPQPPVAQQIADLKAKHAAEVADLKRQLQAALKR